MKNQTRPLAAAGALLCAAGAATAQSNATLYGSVDQYLNYMRSSSGATIRSLNDGAVLRSRLGFRGTEDLGGGYSAKFQLERGLSADTGAPADANRAFDRQAWVGLASRTLGELRLGRQNTAIFYRGDYVDFSSRTLGSVVNAFGVPSRYDNDIAYISPRRGGALVELHYALAETPGGVRGQAIYQAAVDYLAGPVRVGYAGLRGRAPEGAAQTADVRYDNLYFNYDFGKGKVYATYVRSNNSTSSGSGATLVHNGGTILGNVGGTVAGTNADVNRHHDIWQLSADYLVTPLLRVGALWGRIHDTSGGGRNASGGMIGAYYALSRNTSLLAIVETLRNDADAGFRPSGSAGLSPNFSTADDVNGRRIDGVHAGIVHRF